MPAPRADMQKLEGLRGKSGPPFVRREPQAQGLRQCFPIADYHRPRWASVRCGEFGTDWVNSPHAVFELRTSLNRAALRASLEALTRRHSILTARVADGLSGPQFVLDPEREVPVEVIDLSHTA